MSNRMRERYERTSVILPKVGAVLSIVHGELVTCGFKVFSHLSGHDFLTENGRTSPYRKHALIPKYFFISMLPLPPPFWAADQIGDDVL